MPGITNALDVINTTFADHKGPLIMEWAQSIRFMRALLDKAQIRTSGVGGTYIEKTISGGPAAKGVGIYSGTERRPRNYNNTLKKIRVEAHRISVVVEIPKKFIRHNMGPAAVIELIKDRPREVMMGASQDMNKFMLTGVSQGLVFDTSEFGGFVTLNGLYSTGTLTGTTNGVLDFALPAAQTDTVFDLAKSTSYYHYNQYGAITSWATNGFKTLRNAYWQAAQFDESQKDEDKGCDLIVMDPDTFANFMEHQAARVLIPYDQEKSSRPTKGNQYPFENGVAFADYALDRTLFTGAAANGVTYGINTKHWEWVWLEEPTLSDFRDSGPDYDSIYAEFSAHGNPICKKLVSQFAVAGGAL